jgi:hypothetical protein
MYNNKNKFNHNQNNNDIKLIKNYKYKINYFNK